MTSAEAYLVAKQTVLAITPEILLILVATAMMTAGAFTKLPRRRWAWASFGTLVVAIGVLILHRGFSPDPYAAVALNDAFSGYARLALLLMALVILALAQDQVDDARAPEFFGALLMVHAGAMLVAAANDLVFLFVGLELVSIPTYLLLYLARRNATTQEAAMKYFFLSIFSSGLLLFGFAYLYGLTGVSNLKAISFLIHWNNNLLSLPQPYLAVVALVFVTAGLSFRVAAVPFHWYAPDVYEGSPTIMAALLAWIPKAVGFLAMIRVFSALFGHDPSAMFDNPAASLAMISNKGALVAGLVAVATMTLGNTVALRQENLKRLLAYSSIAHAGYLMIGISAAFLNGPGHDASILGSEAVMLYLATYALMTLGAFGMIIALSTPERPVETIDDLAGLLWTHPWAAIGMTLCLFSLAGVPPMAGFYGKLWIFGSALAVADGEHANGMYALTIIGGLNAAIGAYYYLRIVMKMTFSPRPDRPLMPRASAPAMIAVGACASLSLALGLLPGLLVNASRESAVSAISTPEVKPLPTVAATRK